MGEETEIQSSQQDPIMTDSIVTKKQIIDACFISDDAKFRIDAILSFDDECNNGHNTFAITATTYTKSRNGSWVYESGGCLHDKVKKYFPQYAHLIKWHLCETDGPMYYIANTLYHAGDKDHWGLRKGEFKHNRDAEGNLKWRLPYLSQDTIYSMEKPNPIIVEYEPQGITGEGKERDFDAARSCASWPEATDQELMSDNLKEVLEARLPGLMKEFREDMEKLGFTW